MKKFKFALFFGFVFTSLSSCTEVKAQAKVSKKAPYFALVDTNNKKHNLVDYRGKYVVLEWLNHECPYVKKHYESNNMQTLQKKITKKGVIWLSINSSAKGKQGHFSSEKANRLTKEKSASPTAVLIDQDGRVGKKYGAKTTPHMFVIDPSGFLIYAGAIDSINSTDLEDVAKATNYVSEAIEASMAGKKLKHPSTVAYGCSIKY